MKSAALVLVAVLAIVSGAQGRQLLQGTNNTANNVVVRWLVPQNGIIDAVRVPINGTVTFSWTGNHDLWEIPSAQCPSTFTNGSGITQIAPRSTGGTASVTFPQERVRFFACSVPGHCADGQLVAIRVGDARAAAPGPARAPGPSRAASSGYSGNSSPGYTGGSSSNYGSSSGTTSSSGTSSSGYSGNSSPGYAGGSSSNYGDSGK